MNGIDAGGWAGAAAGVLCGLLGSVLGVWCSLRNARGPRERALVWRATMQCALLLGALFAGMWLLPHPARFLLFIPYSLALTFGIRHWNSQQEAIREEESREVPSPSSDPGTTPADPRRS